MMESQPAPKTNNWAIISLILGIISLPMTCCYGIGLFAGIAAIVLGFIGRREIRSSQGAQTGKGLALAGIVLGAITIVLSLLFICGILGMAMYSESVNKIFEDINATLEAQ